MARLLDATPLRLASERPRAGRFFPRAVEPRVKLARVEQTGPTWARMQRGEVVEGAKEASKHVQRGTFAQPSQRVGEAPQVECQRHCLVKVAHFSGHCLVAEFALEDVDGEGPAYNLAHGERNARRLQSLTHDNHARSGLNLSFDDSRVGKQNPKARLEVLRRQPRIKLVRRR